MLKSKIIRLINKAVAQEAQEMVEVFAPQNPDFGDYSTNIAMKLARVKKENPMTIAEKLKESLSDESIKKIEVVKPGYLNFYLREKVLTDNMEKIISDGDKYGRGDLYKGKRIMVEFAHPNPFKVMHIGHLRNITLGESIVRLFETQGAEVIRTNYQGDVGMHVAKCIWALKKVPEAEFPTGVDKRVELLGKSYAEGARAFEDSESAKAEIVAVNKEIYEQSDPQTIKLWRLGVKWSLDKFHEIYERVDSRFDREFMESETLELGQKFVEEALAKKILEKSEGAVVFKGDQYGLETRVFRNSQGFLTYEGKELGLAHMEFTEYGHLDLCVHNVAVEQISFFKVTFKVEELLNPDLYQGKQYHNAYEFVGLKSGKMSSRTGRVVTAESILDEAHKRIKAIVDKNATGLSRDEVDTIAVAAVKYGYLKMSPFKYLAFDLDQSVSFSGDSGPYLLYTYARAKSILRKAGEKVTETKQEEYNPEETAIMKKLFQFTETVENAMRSYSPNYIASYLNELAQLFNNFYTKHPVRGNAFRLNLTKAVAQVIHNGLYLLGIKTLERM